MRTCDSRSRTHVAHSAPSISEDNADAYEARALGTLNGYYSFEMLGILPADVGETLAIIGALPR